jgi:hypothetical protein
MGSEAVGRLEPHPPRTARTVMFYKTARRVHNTLLAYIVRKCYESRM